MKDFKETKDYNLIVNEKGFKVVLFFATWCGPCNMLKPVLEKLSEELTDISFHKINIDEFRAIAVEQDVRSIPTMLLYKDDVLVDRYPNREKKDTPPMMQREQLIKWFDTYR